MVAYGEAELWVLSFEFWIGRRFWIRNFEFWMLNWSPTAKQSFEFWVLSFELVGFADFELFNVELTDNSQLQIQKILMREAH